jgi:hypothetical protein
MVHPYEDELDREFSEKKVTLSSVYFDDVRIEGDLSEVYLR